MIANRPSTAGNVLAYCDATLAPVCVYCCDSTTPFRTLTTTGPLISAVHSQARLIVYVYDAGPTRAHRTRALAS